MVRRIRRFPRSRIGIAVLVVVAAGAGVGVAALVHGGVSPTVHKVAALPPGAERKRSFLSFVIPPPAGGLPGTDVPGRIARRARSLPLAQKVAQMMVFGFQGKSPRDAAAATRGLNVGGVVLDRTNFQDDAQLAALARGI